MQKPWWQHLHDIFLPHERNDHHPHIFRVTSLAAIVVLVFVFELGFLAQLKLVLPSSGFLASVVPGVLAALTNDARAASGVGALTENPVLDKAATLAADDMAAKGYFAHVSPTGTTPWDWLNQVGYQYSYAGENLAVNFSDSEALQSAWMNSPTHHENIVKPEYTQIGFGTADGMYEGKQTTFVVEFFATPAEAAVSAAPHATSTLSAPSAASVAAPKPEQAPASATATGTILGTESAPPAEAQTAAPLAASVSPAHTGFLAEMLASPVTTAELVLAALFAFVAMLMAAALVRHWRLPHPEALAAGTLLLAIVFGLLAANPILAGSVLVPPTATTSASALNALLP